MIFYTKCFLFGIPVYSVYHIPRKCQRTFIEEYLTEHGIDIPDEYEPQTS